MIFLTVGTQLHFDRLVTTVDEWLPQANGQTAFAQVGQTTKKFTNLTYKSRLTPAEISEMVQKSSFVVSHAGMGSILMALKFRKPIIIMPRKAELKEHRNNHQMATAKWLEGRNGVSVAWDDSELVQKLNGRSRLTAGDAISDYADAGMLNKIKIFIEGA